MTFGFVYSNTLINWNDPHKNCIHNCAERVKNEKDILPENHRWTAKRKASLAISIIKENTTTTPAPRDYYLTVNEI